MSDFEGLDHVQVAAPEGCEREARRFYGELLGLPELPKPADLVKRGGCWFVCGAAQLHIGVEANFLPAKKAHPGLRLRGVAAHERLRARLAAAGVAIVESHERVEGVVRFFAEDPFGNRLEFLAAT